MQQSVVGGLLKFDAPRSVLVKTPSAKNGDGNANLNSSLSRSGSKTSLASLSRSQSPTKSALFTDSKSLSGSLSQLTLISPEERRALDAILPPQDWVDDSGTPYTQRVSSTPAMPPDVITLQDDLDRSLRQRQARETGLCPIRGELYAFTFDEIIRQTTINSLEQGMLLLRVRNEIRMTFAAYQRVYESSLAYGMRRALQTEVLKRNLSSEIADYMTDIDNLKTEIAAAVERGDIVQRESAEARAAAQARHDEEVAELIQVRETLTRDLEANLTKKSH